LGGFVGIGLLLLGSFAVWRHRSIQEAAVLSLPAAPVPLQTPLPQDPQIQAFFNQSQSATYTEPYRQQTRLGDDLEQVVVAAIQTAQTSVEVAAHELNLPRVALALQERHQAGVRVRVLVENTYRESLSRLTHRQIQQLDERGRRKYQDYVQWVDQNQDGQLSPEEIAARDAMMILQAAKVPLLDDTADGSKGSDLMHHKFVVIDDRTLVVGSANFTWSDIHGDFSTLESRGNANHLLKISSPSVAKLFRQEFDLMWGEGGTSRFGLKKPYRAAQAFKLAPHSQIAVQFSPTSKKLPWQQSVNGLIAHRLGQARRSIHLALFVFSDQQLSNALETKQQQGVQIQALIDPGFAYRDYSEALDLMGVALPNSRCRYEVNNRPWSKPLTTVGIPQLPAGDLLHHKFAVIDGQVVITGSQNWSEAANSSNDENLLVIHNAIVAAHFQREFERLYEGAIWGLPATVKSKVQQKCSRPAQVTP
jgi:phosphatidylserine/phosphatidylglycerophosphate/cardiolipin synthase-like enzyme